MHVLDLRTIPLDTIRDYQSNAAAAAQIASGTDEAHIYWLRFEPGGCIGPHPAGFAQLLLPIDGSGWVAGSTGKRHPITAGQAAFIANGEVHSKGSEAGMAAIMIQVAALDLFLT